MKKLFKRKNLLGFLMKGIKELATKLITTILFSVLVTGIPLTVMLVNVLPIVYIIVTLALVALFVCYFPKIKRKCKHLYRRLKNCKSGKDDDSDEPNNKAS
ncbi:hypothetical protein [Priestia filamentosa]|uniref:hypothetical protein n=1 Tax=Priestia filamentosa TaxID=1402861 RepID=UPI0039825D96